MFLLFSGVPAGSAGLPQYCQYPPYVLQSVLPSVTLLVSNSVSMLQFAYGDNVVPTNPCNDNANACGGFVPTNDYYGLFDNNYWYRGTTGGGGGFTRTTLVGGTRTNPTNKSANSDWHGNFLNWLTSRRVDVMRKVLTGGTGEGTQLCGAGVAEWKKFRDDRTFTGINTGGSDQIVRFPKSTNCAGTLLGSFVLIGSGNPSYNIRNQSAGTTSGIIQDATPRASLGIAFYNNSDSQGANLDPQVDGSNIPISAYRNRIDTPSRFNGLTVGAPLGEALWSIVGSYAMIGTTDSTDGPRYHNVDYNPGKDPYWFHGGPARCVKGNVIVISDGEPCNDGNLPSSYSGVPGGSILNYAEEPINCDVNGVCSAAPTFGPFPTSTSIPACASGGSTGGFEDVALFAHTNDLRGPTFGVNNLDRMQNLDIYVVRAFGSDNSNLLKYGAINGSFELSLGDNTTVPGKILPRPGSFTVDGGPGSAYHEAQDGFAIREALDDIFENLLRRATSGTAASVLASGEGSGANIVQAVFYPRRRFFEEVIEWTGTLNNFWYFVDPFFGGASIREESQPPVIDLSTGNERFTLNLVNDNTVEFFFDPVSETTKANTFSNSTTTGNKTGSSTTVLFEAVKSIWEAGKFLHASNPSSRTIFTAVDNGSRPAHLSFVDNNASTVSSLRSYLAVPTDAEAATIIRYVRGYDDINGDGVIDFRQRTVPFPVNNSSDNTVWMLGDIINSTPKVASRVPLNTYQKTYNDLTYKNYVESPGYRDRGMVFAGANDGMLHAFKLGKLEFPGDNTWTGPLAWDRARLRNLDPTVKLGAEQWAFVPKNTLPYLQALLDPNYCHLFYVDLAPQLFDASIPESAADNAARTAASWRTVLIGGMRFGGACRDNTATCTNCVKSPVSGDVGLSSYFAIDVTDPEDPTVLWEFTDPGLGFATTGPAVIRVNTRTPTGELDRTTNGKWFVVFGSGPTGPITNRQFLGKSDQNLKLFVVDLESGDLVRTVDQFGGSTISNAFAGSMINSTADINLDYEDDAVYIGYVRENSGVWNRGGVLRLLTNGSTDPNDWEARKVIENIGPVTASVVRLQNNVLHTNWLFFGTGRYYFTSTTGLDDPSEQRKLYGVKDPCFNSLNTFTPNCTATVADGDLTLADTPPTFEPAQGWKINLDLAPSVNYDNTTAKSYQAERVITDPLATTSGVVFFTTYRPYGDDCAIGGRTFLWAVQYNTGGVPLFALRGRALMQVSTASVEQLDLSSAFRQGDAYLNKGGRRSYALEGVPPTAQGLSLLSPPPPVKRIMHMIER
jgi:type IV pilus assembly protein PilY1